MLKAGGCKIDITPSYPIPLSGYITKKDRISTHIRDKIYARALILDDGKKKLALVSIDLLIITRELYQKVKEKLNEVGLSEIKLMLHATHDHSSFGGYYRSAGAKMFMGSFRQEIFDHLVDSIVKAVIEANEHLFPAKMGYAKTMVKGFNENRRLKGGPTDEELGAISIKELNGCREIVIINYTGHPVIAAEKDFYAISGDFPGALCRRLEKKRNLALYLNGGIGGMSIIFPKEIIDCQEHLDFVSGHLEEKAEEAIGKIEHDEKPCLNENLGFLSMPEININPFPKPLSFLKIFIFPLTFWFSNRIKEAITHRTTIIQNLVLGKTLIAGMPADLGVTIALGIKKKALEAGFNGAMVASHCNDFVGYYHLPEDYRKFPGWGEFIEMFLYENAMSFFGHNFGAKMLELEEELISSLAKSYWTF